MLKFLNISNLVLVDSLQINFSKGLNILSGETGSGKSIIIDAVGLLLGNRFSPEMIRSGASTAFVEGVFGVEGNLPLVELLCEAGVEVGEEDLIIKREISSGKSRIFINNQSATLALLRQAQPHLIDIHGQGDQQSLAQPLSHLKLYDAFSGGESLRLEIEALYESLDCLVQEIDGKQKSDSERLQQLDILNYQIQEIEASGIRLNEDSDLEAERKMLANAEKLFEISREAYELLYDDEKSVFSLIVAIQKLCNEITDLDDRFSEYGKLLDQIKYNAEEVAYFLRGYAQEVEVSPERLTAIDERLTELYRLKRKYSPDLQGIIEVLEGLQKKKKELGELDTSLEKLKGQLGERWRKLQKLSAQLSKFRQKNVHAFEKRVSAEFSEVALAEARFVAQITPVDTDRVARWIAGQNYTESSEPVCGRYGAEQVEFLFSANPGEELRSLGMVASGGELSRLMLVLKTITAPTQFPRTLIFDEIDSGIGGRVAEAVGKRLRKLSETNQVLCVTHQAQIARYSDSHLTVYKEISGERTFTRVVELAEKQQVDELARMLGGSEATAKRHAKELLKWKQGGSN